MQAYFAVLILFLLAFSGLAAGLLLKRRGLRGGCGAAPGAKEDCQCHAKQSRGRSSEVLPCSRLCRCRRQRCIHLIRTPQIC